MKVANLKKLADAIGSGANALTITQMCDELARDETPKWRAAMDRIVCAAWNVENEKCHIRVR